MKREEQEKMNKSRKEEIRVEEKEVKQEKRNERVKEECEKGET